MKRTVGGDSGELASKSPKADTLPVNPGCVVGQRGKVFRYRVIHIHAAA